MDLSTAAEASGNNHCLVEGGRIHDMHHSDVRADVVVEKSVPMEGLFDDAWG